MSFTWRLPGLVATLAVTLILVGSRVGARHDEASDPRAAFRRPAGPGARGDAIRRDPVWDLGRTLFFDPRLSASATLSCGSCHQPGHGWTDTLPRAVGDAHRPLAVRVPTLIDAASIDRYGWTGRFADLQAVTFFAITSPTNMNLAVPQVLARLGADPAYVARFAAAFPDGAVSKGNVGAALARFVGSIRSAAAPFDRWAAGDTAAIDTAAARGFALFVGKGRCAECHSGPSFTDGSFHDAGIGRDEIGRGAFFKSSLKLQHAFKTPTLRDVAVRGPYMHDGSLRSLEEVVDHYDKGGIDRPSRADAIGPLHLSEREKADLVAFLGTLTGGTSFAGAATD